MQRTHRQTHELTMSPTHATYTQTDTVKTVTHELTMSPTHSTYIQTDT